jgi:hypothetical protein
VAAKKVYLPGSGSVSVGQDVFSIPSGQANTSQVTGVVSSKSAKGRSKKELVAKPVTVGHVTTPYLETREWLNRMTNSIDVIEVETAYLSNALKGKANYQAFFLISDVVGSEHETLAQGSSDKRKNTLKQLLQEVISQEEIRQVIPASESNELHRQGRFAELLRIRKHLEKVAPNRSLESRYQVEQVALHNKVTSEDQIEQLASAEKPFSREILVRSLTASGHIVSVIAETMQEKKISTRFYLPPEFMEGRWNPSRPLEILIQTESSSGLLELEAEIARVKTAAGALGSRSIEILTTSREPETHWLDGIIAPPESSHALADIYSQIALSRGGLFSIINSTGQIRFTRVPELKTDHESLSQKSNEITHSGGGAPKVRCEQIFLRKAS